MEQRPRDGARTHSEIREAALELFVRHGYEATSLRTLADTVGIKVGSLYNHMGGKDDLLLDIMMSVMERLLESSRAALEQAGPDPINQLKALIDNHLQFHARNARETFVGNSELRALSGEQRRMMTRLRREYEEMLKSQIEAAAKAADVPLLDARLQTYAVIALGMHLASWYRDTSQVSLEHVVKVYTELSLRQLGLAEVTAGMS